MYQDYYGRDYMVGGSALVAIMIGATVDRGELVLERGKGVV